MYEIPVAAIILLGTVGAGLVAHELAHAAVLSAFGITYEIEWFPKSSTAGFSSAHAFGTWATVTPSSISPEVSPWKLRVSAVAPLALAVPPSLVLLEVVSLDWTGLWVAAVVVGSLGCALPSPQDFSLFWHAGRIIEAERTAAPEEH